MKQHKTKRKRLLVLALCLLTALSMLPMTAMAGADANSAAEGQVTITKTLVSSTPDDDGNYTIKLTVQGNPVTHNVKPNADVVLVVDCSGSMDDTFFFFDFNTRMAAAKKAGRAFADKILTTGSGNQMAVIGFSSKGYGQNGTAIDVTTGKLLDNKNTIYQAINSMEAGGGTDYTAALTEAKRILDNRSNQTRPGYVVFISDGAPGANGESHDDPKWNGSEQVTQLKAAKIKIYTVEIELNETEAMYLKSMATDDKHYINISKNSVGKDLEGILTEWAETINSVPAGTNAVMTDVINDKHFEYVSSEEGLSYDGDKKSLTWNIGDIPEQEQSVTFKIKPKEGWHGTENTNASCKLTYTKPNKTAGEETAPSPQITLAATTGTVTINKTVTGLGNDTEKLPDKFTFKIMQGEEEKATVTATKNANGGYNAATANDLPYGSYTVVEEGASIEGYELTTTGLAETITLSKETPTATVDVTNTYIKQEPLTPPVEAGLVTIKKVVTGLSSENLPGSFTFDIKRGDEIKETVTVTKNDEGTYDDATTRSLEVGTYTVVEREQNVFGYHVTTSSDPANGELELTKEGATITFTNSYEMIPPNTGTLIVKKTVSGSGAERDKAFTFTVKLEMARPEAMAVALMNDMPNNGDPSGDGPSNIFKLVIGGVTFEGNGEAYVGTFTLKHNESKTLPIPTSDYPAGWNYTVTENDNDGYTVTVDGEATGVIKAEETAIVKFNNHKDGGYTPGPTYYPLTIQKVVTGLESVPAGYKATVNVMSKYSSVPTRTLMLEPNKPQTVHLPYGEYTLTETAPAVDGYKLTGQTFSETTFMLTYGGKNVTITNAYTKEQEEPVVIPDDPMAPEDDKPDKPSKVKDDTSKVPKTGDDTPLSLALYGLIAAGALLGIRKAAKRKIK